MATARKNKSTAKAATPPSTVGSDFLKPKKATEKKAAAKKKDKPTFDLPSTLALALDDWAAADMVSKACTRKISDSKPEVLAHVLEDFAHRWAKSGVRPESCTWRGTRSKFDHVVTSAITFDAKKQEAIEDELDIDMSEYFEVVSLKIDIKKLEGNKKFYEAFVEFLKVLGSDVDEYVDRDFKLSPDFFDNLGKICNQNPDSLHTMLKILKPRVTPKNVKSHDAEEDLFNTVREMKG